MSDVESASEEVYDLDDDPVAEDEPIEAILARDESASAEEDDASADDEVVEDTAIDDGADTAVEDESAIAIIAAIPRPTGVRAVIQRELRHEVRIAPAGGVSVAVKEIIIVPPEDRVTTNIMSKFEMTEYVSIRAAQISKYTNCMVDISGLSDPVSMAKRELMHRKCPLMLRRHVGDVIKRGITISYYEDWNPAEMSFAVHYPDEFAPTLK